MSHATANLALYAALITGFAILVALGIAHQRKLSVLRRLNGGYVFYENPKIAKQVWALRLAKYILVAGIVLALARSAMLTGFAPDSWPFVLLFILGTGIAVTILDNLVFDLLIRGSQ